MLRRNSQTRFSFAETRKRVLASQKLTSFAFRQAYDMKIATWNINSLNVRLPHVQDWLQQYQPDVLVLQELKLDQDKFPAAAIEMLGFHAAWSGQKTYNGVAIISKTPVEDVSTGLPTLPDDPQRRVIAATINGVRIINVYCVNG